MIRGMHYMCWFKDDWNYHPSMPMKRLQQIQDIVDMNGNLLLWSCLGSGAVGLPYLEKEANEVIPPRLRFYGYMNDKEFCQECGKRGITAFAVVWMAQLWEFPAEFNDDESELLALNKLRGVGKKGWLGIRELSTDRYPKLFPPMRTYFPEGIRDADGQPLKDFLHAFKAMTLDGNDIFSTWLMVPGHDHLCYTPCANKSSYLQYLRREIEMIVDVGAQGIHLDEYDVQLHAVKNGGCFCKECMQGFRTYLQQHPCEESTLLNLDRFDYRTFLQEKGYVDQDLLAQQDERRWSIPLFKQFIRFNLERTVQNVADLTGYAKAYALQQRGETILVTVNMFNCLPHTGLIRTYCDLIVGEKSEIKLRQDGFYRFGRAYMQEKEGSFIEDPNPHILQIVEDIENNKHDTYILFMMEPLAQGFNGAIPYGAWLMNFKQDSFYPAMHVERKRGQWLQEHEFLFTHQPVAETALVYDLRSALESELFLGGHLERGGGFRTFHELTQMLCNAHILYTVLYVSDDQPLTPERLSSYKKLILPDAFSLHDEEIAAIRSWMSQGGKIAALGKVDRKLYDTRFTYSKFVEFIQWLKEGGQILEAEDIEKIGIGLHKRAQGYTLHLVNYQLNSWSREIEPVAAMSFKLSWKPERVEVYSFPESEVAASIEGNMLHIKKLGIYTIVDLQ